MALLRNLLFLALFLLPHGVQAEEGKLQLAEQKIKAGLLYNFLKYTDWPSGAEADKDNLIHVCLFGNGSFKDYLQPMNGRSVNQKEIAVRAIGAVSEAAHCHLVFIEAPEKARWPQMRDALAGKNVLTVGDFSGFARDGGMIEFTHARKHMRVDLNLKALESAKLRMQDRLLHLVAMVHADTQRP
jgi:hypothetical protein